MRRHEFIALLGAAVVAWPLAASSQQTTFQTVGYLHPDSPQPMARLLAAFREGLSEAGYVEGRNVAVEYRWAGHDNSRLPELVADLVRRQVAVIAVPGSTTAALAAKAATATIPIVFSIGGDPVQAGLIISLNRPGGNITGVNSMNTEVAAKRLGLLHDLLPAATRFAALVNPKNATTALFIRETQTAAAAIGRQIEVHNASTSSDIDEAFARLMQRRPDALLVHPDVVFITHRAQLVTLAMHHALPAVYPFREDAEVGGLMSYGTSLTEAHRQVGIYTGRILKGEKPADLPVIQPTKFELLVNMKAAKALGLTIPPPLLARADELIE